MDGRRVPKAPEFEARVEVGDCYFLMVRQEVKHNEMGKIGWKTGEADIELTKGRGCSPPWMAEDGWRKSEKAENGF